MGDCSTQFITRFDDLLHGIQPYIRHSRKHRCPITPQERFAVTHRVLASGNNQSVCLRGSLDYQMLYSGRKLQRNSGNDYFNYKGTHSLVLMAVCHATYRFTMVDIGAYGSESDSGIFQECRFVRDLLLRNLELVPPANLPGSSVNVPHVFLGDGAFSLPHKLMRPFPGKNLDDAKRIYNYVRPFTCQEGGREQLWHPGSAMTHTGTTNEVPPTEDSKGCERLCVTA
ncbi:uncharacterized protein LOC129179981 isoform X3 [Dunckerocampus dactyliophorus]|uniref:uncharacterized protein LOC129179981 isoform X3 n=1 Tax=Dunckerocampus dactyliophorus TaxID=161453 RepID=UPI0024060F77|nr:uncharacterized protein LOC129179981 isoform X3 [Dunckerocampus dactyliophorus]XP_054629887.1 uncharacterized protein LOC129179981 isoform X3 [Dunckerocampus dactyliophorus]XP_054629888.1 uncharacterized protein LOC129179981 isoform X3 [Dunckerocampus dactyliophorus]